MPASEMACLHISEDDLERYALGCLPEAQEAPLEEHLLVCEECRDRLARWDEYVGAMRAACRETTSVTGGA